MKIAYQTGQSMVEYVVILMAITLALISTVADDSGAPIGFDKDEEGSLVQAMHQRYSEQNYALRLTELPELPSLADNQAYYDELNKFPELAKNLGNLSAKLNETTAKIEEQQQKLVKLKQYQSQAANIKDTIGKEINNAKDDVINNLTNIF